LPCEEALADRRPEQRRQSAMALAAIAGPPGKLRGQTLFSSTTVRIRTLRSFSACRWRRSTTAGMPSPSCARTVGPAPLRHHPRRQELRALEFSSSFDVTEILYQRD
jgi:hypothetical protein